MSYHDTGEPGDTGPDKWKVKEEINQRFGKLGKKDRSWLLSEPKTGFLGWANRHFGKLILACGVISLLAIWITFYPDQFVALIKHFHRGALYNWLNRTFPK